MATMVSGAALKTIASTAVNSQIRGYKERRAEAKSQVDWEDYNYPPYLRVLHYNLDDVEDITPMLTSPRCAPHPLPLSKRRSNRSCCAQAAAAYGLGDGDPQTLRPRHGCG